MTYHPAARRRPIRTAMTTRGRRPVYAPLGAVDLGIDPSGGIGAQATRIDRDWHPTGYYTPQDVISIVGQLTTIYVKVRDPLGRFVKDFGASPWGPRARSELAKVDETHVRAQSYASISVTAMSQGKKYMDAPGLKALVVGYLRRMSLAMSALRQMLEEWEAALRALSDAVLGSPASALLAAFRQVASTAAPAAEKVANAIMKVAGVAYDVVKGAVDLVKKIPDTIGTMFTLLKWGVIFYGGILLYKEIRPSRAPA